mgnify:CR=1 FL=1
MYLHLISFDVPLPANYGGVIVVFHQLKALHAQGVRVILHCFVYGDRTPQPELENYCQEVHYYPRSRAWIYQLSTLPFVMRTRMQAALLRRLSQDEYPILFEGIHTAGFIGERRLRNRKKIIRMHNVEWQYYEGLSASANKPLHKAYFWIESLRLRKIELRIVRYSDLILTLSYNDQRYYQTIKPGAAVYLPAFHPNERVTCEKGRGEYVLFHGKLSVPDNERAALWLIKNVFSRLSIPFVIAGMAPSARLREAVAPYEHIRLIADPSDARMNQLISEAQINLLISFQAAGIKLKLINALFRGRYCIVNEEMVQGSLLASLCIVRNTPREIRQTVEAYINASFSQSQIQERAALLASEYDNAKQAGILKSLIFG